MARLLFEEQGIRTRRGRLVTDGTIYVVYTDAAGTVPADISATSGGPAIPGSAVVVADIAGLGPAAFRFYGSPDGQDTLYVRCLSDASLGVQEIEADTDERLDALEGGGGGGGAHPNLAVHDALGLATDAELTAHTTDVDPHAGYVQESAHTLATHDTLGLATDTELSTSVTSAVSTHAAASDPHAGYELESDHTLAAHNTLGLATDAELTAHAAASDPHGDRAYADATTQGLDPKASVLVKSTGDLTLSGEQTIDGVLTSASRVLVADQTAAEENGIYVTAAGAWTRATDADVSGEVTTGLYTYVEEGTTQASSGWVLTTPAPITLGTTPLVFSQFSQAGQVFGGAGLVKTGNTLDVTPGPGLTVTADTVGITPGGVSATELAAAAVTDTKVAPAAAIDESKLALNFPTHAEDHAARHAAAGADPLAGYATSANLASHEGAIDPHQGYVLESAHTLGAHDVLGLATDAELVAHDIDTVTVHGIADTSKIVVRELLTQAVIDAHAVDGRALHLAEGQHNAAGQLVAKDDVDWYGEGPGKTFVYFPTDLGLGVAGIIPQTAAAGVNHAPSFHDFSVVGPGVGLTMGVAPANMDGILVGTKWSFYNVWVQAFRSGIVIVRDHQHFHRVRSRNNYYNVYYADVSGLPKGNQHYFNCDFTGASFASIGMHANGQADACTFFGGDTGFAPYGFYKEPGAITAFGVRGMLTNSILRLFSFEAIGNAAFLDESSGGAGDSLHSCNIVSPGFTYSPVYTIAGRSADYAVNVRNISNCTIDGAAAFPFANEDVGTFKVTGGGSNLLRQAAFPTMHLSCAGLFRIETGNAEGILLKAQTDFTAGDLVEGDSSQVRRYGTQDRAFAGVALTDATSGGTVWVARTGKVSVRANEAVAGGGVVLVPDESNLVRVKAAPSTGSSGYVGGSATAVPNKHPIIGYADRDIASGALGTMWLAPRSNRTYVTPGAVTALPTASATYRGQLLRVQGAAGAADVTYQCLKSAANTYSWVTVATG